MKYLLLFFISALLSTVSAQDFKHKHPFPIEEGEVNYTKVVEVEGASADQLFSAAIEFFSSDQGRYRRSSNEKNNSFMNMWLGNKKDGQEIDELYRNEDPVSFQSQELKKIIVNVTNKYTGSTMGCVRVLYLTYDIIVQFKNGRYKYELTNFSYVHYNQTNMREFRLYGSSRNEICNEKNSLENLMRCKHCTPAFRQLFTYLHKDNLELIREMNEQLSTPPKASDNDW